MAKLECTLYGDFDEMLYTIEQGILSGSISASQEGKSDYINSGIKCAVRVYERYSMMGGNRVSLNVTLVGKDEAYFLSAITAGGSQAILFKLNTFGEEAFLDCLKEVIKKYRRS